MRILFTFISTLAVLPFLFGQCSGAADLIISQYVEGSSFNKCIEIYNGTGAVVNLTNYEIEIYFNGSGSAGTTIDLSTLGTLGDGSVYVICDDGTTIFTADLVSTSSFFSGDDAIALVNNGSIIDVFGEIGVDPGTQWGSGACGGQNATLVRDVTTPGTCPSPQTSGAFDPDAWADDCLGTDDVTDLGLPQTTVPVEFSGIEARRTDDGNVNILWSTAAEVNNDLFIVQHSIDGRKFEDFATIEGAGTTYESTTYSAEHNSPIKGINYYRVAQVDYDGTTSNSDVVSIQMARDLSLDLRPTIVEHTLTYDVGNATAKMVIMSIDGSMYQEQYIDNQGQIDCTHLAPGLYTVTVVTGTESVTQRITKI